jgi:predicted nuclease with TOPRIM domain
METAKEYVDNEKKKNLREEISRLNNEISRLNDEKSVLNKEIYELNKNRWNEKKKTVPNQSADSAAPNKINRHLQINRNKRDLINAIDLNITVIELQIKQYNTIPLKDDILKKIEKLLQSPHEKSGSWFPWRGGRKTRTKKSNKSKTRKR